MNLTAPLRGPVAQCAKQRGPNARLNALAIEAASRLVDVTPGTRDWLICALTFADPETGELWPTCSRVRRAMPSRRTGGLVGERSPARWKHWAAAAGYIQSARLLPGKLTPIGQKRRAAGLPLRAHDWAGHGTCVVTIDFARLGLRSAPLAARRARRDPRPSAAHVSAPPTPWSANEAASGVRTRTGAHDALAAALSGAPSSTPPTQERVKVSRPRAPEGLSGRLAELAARIEERLEARDVESKDRERGRDPP